MKKTIFDIPSVSKAQPAPAPSPALALATTPTKTVVLPSFGEVITSAWTKNSYTMGSKIGEGHFSDVFACQDAWKNELAAKVLKPLGTYDRIRENAVAEFEKLRQLRNPNITFVYDAFEYRDTFYIITERCDCPLSKLFTVPNFAGQFWIIPIARCLLQAVHYLHIHNYVHQDIHVGNVFASWIKDEMSPDDASKSATKFKLGDLGVAKLRQHVTAINTRALWMLPPEVLDEAQFGPIDSRVDIYHLGLLFLQIAQNKELRFTKEEILAGKPRELALELPPPFGFALEKMLRRRVQFRTANAMEAWRDLNSPPQLSV